MNEHNEILASADFTVNSVPRISNIDYNHSRNFFIVVILIEIVSMVVAAVA
jgi:hypothetical protein